MTQTPLQQTTSPPIYLVRRCIIGAESGDAGQLQRVYGNTDLQSAFDLIEQEISFSMQTFLGSVKKPDYGTTGAAPSQPTPLCFMPPNETRRS